jgi:hypothetical protein
MFTILPPHHRCGGAHQVQVAQELEIQVRLPRLVVEVHESTYGSATDGVDQNIQPSVPGHCRIDDAIRLVPF